ncbi:uncharacterized protein MKK02DRAFT_45699 [Dioszegia hungarica]|uniref:Uncharacterized protein n=1 Tax=Dioszegia hungarica TaxID=4972 RepID=A0AA38LVB5_9TREE|nr:uncharacterized protein MKK02DRAFT_45699 [Dioszegia hungarica]KAI9636990.1 hypothetical protein MKK02DRAFT_45699 [Dioszegia hungarica]
MPDVWTIYLSLSLIPIIPLLLTLLPHALPSRLTSLSPISRAGPIGVSLICLEIIRAGKTLLSQQILEGSRRDGGSPAVILMCEVDTVISAYLSTALFAHLPMIAYSLLKSSPTPSNPQPSVPRTRYLISLIYSYALIPVLPILADAGMEGFSKKAIPGGGSVGGGFGEWWGLYCVERDPWWRIGVSAYFVLMVYTSYPGLWRTYRHWMRFSLAPPANVPVDHPDPLDLPSFWTSHKPRRPTSSFYAPPTPPRRLRSTSRKQPSRLQKAQLPVGPDEKDGIPALQMRYFVDSVYSDSPPPISPSSVYTKTTFPTLTAYSSWTAVSAVPVENGRSGLFVPTRHPLRLSRILPSQPSPSRPPPSSHFGSRSRSTIRSFLNLMRTSHQTTPRTAPPSPPFIWSIHEPEPEPGMGLLAQPPRARRRESEVFSDGASSVSRYSLTSLATPEGQHDRYLESLERDGGGGRRRQDSRDWVYPEEVFVDFSQEGKSSR